MLNITEYRQTLKNFDLTTLYREQDRLFCLAEKLETPPNVNITAKMLHTTNRKIDIIGEEINSRYSENNFKCEP